MSSPSEQWEDLFALAEGRTPKTHESVPPVSTSPTTPAQKKSKKNHDRSSASSSPSRRHQRRKASSRDDYLSERLSNSIEVPEGFTYGSSLVGGRGGDTRFRKKLIARQADPLLELFCCLRNLRHVLFLSIKGDVSGSTHLVPLVAEFKSLKGRLSSLDEKTKEKTWKLINRLTIEQMRSSPEFHRIVPLIMDCDSLYYDLYYMQLTSPYQRVSFLPHPTFYFGESINELSRALAYAEGCQNRTKEDALLKFRFPMHDNIQKEDPLTFLHHVRFLETIQIFHLSGWYSSAEKRRDEFLKAGRDPIGTDLYDLHETPAPSLLCEWRDSCRDFLTHLYAYATIPAQTRKAMQEFAGTQRIVEVGAGTAYLANLLRQQGQVIDAFDIHPGEQNEYHGATPPFMKINPGTGGKVVSEERHPFVLLLCYPPPDSAMAVDVLKAFWKRGGDKLIHVGEFKGLTGTPRFEQMLVEKFRCVKNLPCPTWGTDASSVTFWEKRHDGDTHLSDTLQPCFLCDQESSHRLRYARYLTFCSKKCWKKAHRNETLSDHLKLSTIQLGSSFPGFRDNTAFHSWILPPMKTCDDGEYEGEDYDDDGSGSTSDPKCRLLATSSSVNDPFKAEGGPGSEHVASLGDWFGFSVDFGRNTESGSHTTTATPKTLPTTVNASPAYDTTKAFKDSTLSNVLMTHAVARQHKHTLALSLNPDLVTFTRFFHALCDTSPWKDLALEYAGYVLDFAVPLQVATDRLAYLATSPEQGDYASDNHNHNRLLSGIYYSQPEPTKSPSTPPGQGFVQKPVSPEAKNVHFSDTLRDRSVPAIVHQWEYQNPSTSQKNLNHESDTSSLRQEIQRRRAIVQAELDQLGDPQQKSCWACLVTGVGTCAGLAGYFGYLGWEEIHIRPVRRNMRGRLAFYGTIAMGWVSLGAYRLYLG